MPTAALTVACALTAGALWCAAAPVPKGDKLPPPTKEQLAASVLNLKNIAIAFDVYHEVNNFFPNNTYTAKGQPLLSWRVQILPYIDENDLYLKFHLDEPWDSEHNKALISELPRIYAPIRMKAKEGETFYRVFAGKLTPFGSDNGAKGKRMQVKDITDGLSNVGFVFEAAEPVTWTKPDDLPFDEKKPLPKLGGLFEGDFHVLMGDGSVAFLRKNAPEDDLLKLIMHADGARFHLQALSAK